MNALEWFVAVTIAVYVPIEISIPVLIYRFTKNWDIVHDRWLMRKTGNDIGEMDRLPPYLEKLLTITNWIKLVAICSVSMLILYRLMLLK